MCEIRKIEAIQNNMAVEVPLIGHKSFSFHIRAEELHSFKDGTLCLYLIQRFHLIKNTFDSSLEYDFFGGIIDRK